MVIFFLKIRVELFGWGKGSGSGFGSSWYQWSITLRSIIRHQIIPKIL